MLKNENGLVRDLNPGPLAPEAKIIPLDIGVCNIPYSWIRHIETITRQPLHMADRAGCYCSLFFISNTFNVEYAQTYLIYLDHWLDMF